MSDAIKEHDFIEIEYTAIIKDTNQTFDTTDEKTARSANIYNKNQKYNPIIICIGENQILKGLDGSLKGKQIREKEYEIILQPENAFGKKNPKLLQLVSQSSFRKQNIVPYPGLQINMDGIMGTVRTVTPGRIIIDFNHPLAGKTIIYKIKIRRKVTGEKEKIDSIISFYIKDFSTEIKEDEAVISAKVNIPKQIQDIIKEKITNLTAIKNIEIKKE